MALVFVYGTLKRGFYNNRVLQGAEFISEHITSPQYTMITLGAFPGVIQQGDTAIKGELFKVDNEIGIRLDRLEGYPEFYGKATMQTEFGEATMYVLDDSYIKDDNVLAEGVWR